jgi:hypothetical protein
MELYEELRSLIALVRRRWTWLVALRTTARASAVLAMLLVVGAIVEYVFRLQGIPLLVLAGATAVLALAVAALATWLTPGRPSDRRVARFIEERAKALSGLKLDDSLVSAIDAADRPADTGSAAFLPLMLADAVTKLRAIRPAEILTHPELRRGAWRAASGVALLLMALVASAPFFERAAATARLRFLPGSVSVEVLPGNVRIPAGSTLRIRASLHGSSGVLTRVTPDLTVSANGEPRTVAMTLKGDAFEFTIGSVDRTFSYVVSAGSARSPRYTVTALTAPRVERIDLHYVYPSFAGLAPRDEQDGGDIYAPAGTRVRLRIQTDKPVARGELALGRSPAVSLQEAGERTIEAELLLARNDSYRIRLADGDGLKSAGEAEYFIRLMDDRPPDVRILRPSADQQITPLEEVPIEARADDDYGIGTFELVYSVAGGPEHVVPFERITGTNVQKIGTRLLPAEDLGVKPGDVVTYYARARDVGRGKRSTETTSDIFFLEVKPFNGEFVAAESQAGAGGSDQQIEGLIQAQKEIISSTWNVERRSQGGRSADDVKAIAAAQAELKSRAEQQLMPRTGLGRAPAPERQAPAAPQPRRSTGDPIATAVDAMGKALQLLTTERTKEALTHEMAALNGLLQAQAEVRRRQVTQQANGAGSPGSNRAEQDLSALFDKELQRQQRTNYETRASVETRPDRGESQDSALDRIRDLARRQEDLSRRQAELAQARLGADEMKRQLEKLTREQTALREQAEELLRRNRERNAPSRGRSGQPPSGAGGASANQGQDALRDATDQMRSAASDLRRDDPNGAAQNGQRAAEQLRRLERQVRGPNVGASAGADVKLEAQQIAQEQGRIAAEANRLDRNAGASAADARKRLADEKDRLAERVQDVTRSALQASQSLKGSDATALGDAARDLQRERVSDRMRETAKAMRNQGAAPNGTGAREQELARTLEQIADKLGASSSAEARQLTDQLDRARAIRDRVQRAEQQLRAAEGRERDGSGPNGSSMGEGRRAQSARGDRSNGTGTAGGREGSGRQGSEIQRLREEYQRELQRAEDALGRLSAGEPRSGLAGSTPEEQQFSRSAPGTEAFKQDRTGWESLRRNLDTALEKYEASVSDRLLRKRPDDRFSAGGSDRVPDAYRQLIAKYFESLAKKKP